MITISTGHCTKSIQVFSIFCKRCFSHFFSCDIRSTHIIYKKCPLAVCRYMPSFGCKSTWIIYSKPIVKLSIFSTVRFFIFILTPGRLLLLTGFFPFVLGSCFGDLVPISKGGYIQVTKLPFLLVELIAVGEWCWLITTL